MEIVACRTSIHAMCLVFGALATLPVSAQQAGVTVLDPIVVTGERQPRQLSETYVGASIITEDRIEQDPQAHLNDVLRTTPNLFVEGKSELPSIRGVQGGGAGGLVSAGLTGALPRLSIIVDGVTRPAVLPNSSASSLWDTRQVEVLRGPQTLLRGRSGLAGAVIVDTNDPAFQPEAAIQSGIELDEFHGPDLFLNGMVSGPLSDVVAGRLAFELKDGADPRRATDVDDDWITEYDNVRIRAKLLGNFDTALGAVTAKVLAEHQAGQTPQTRNTVQGPVLTGRPLSDRILVNAAAGPLGIPARTFNTRATTLALDTSLDLGHGTLQSISSYTGDDYDSISGQVYEFPFDVEEDIFVQEFLYEFGPDTRVRSGQVGGLLGLAFEKRAQTTEISGLFRFQSDVETASQSAFADLRYGLTDGLTVFGGTRLQRYADSRIQVSAAGPIAGQQRFFEIEYAVLPSLGLAYHFDEDRVFSASARRGYNPGGSSVNIFSGAPYQYESETVSTFESTYRHTALGGRLNVGATAFYNLFDDPQFYAELVPGNRASLQVVNQRKGVSYGVEFDASWRVNDRLQLSGSLGLLDTEITEASAITPTIEGNTFGQDPNLTASLGAVFRINDYLSIDGRVTYRGESFNDFNNISADKVGDYTIVDLGVTTEYRNFKLRGYVNNLFDETGVTRFISNQQYADVTDPLTAGLTITARW